MVYILGISSFLSMLILLFIASNIICFASELIEPSNSDLHTYIFLLITSVIPLILSYYASRKIVNWYMLRKKIFPTISTEKKLTLTFIAILYLLTSLFGSPAIQSKNISNEIAIYKSLKAENDPRLSEDHPYIKTYISIPVLPFVVVSFHEYQLSGLYGWGGWSLQIWYVTGVKNIAELPIWRS